MGRLTEEQKKEVCERYAAGENTHELAGVFPTSQVTIAKIVRVAGLTRSNAEVHRKYHVDHEYFDHIVTPEQAYWLGVLACDGNIYRRTRRGGEEVVLTLGFKEGDRELLIQFLEDLRSNYPIKRNDRVREGRRFSFLRAQLASKQLATALEEQGLAVRKTFDLSWPSIPSRLLSHYVRGVADADVTWAYSEGKGGAVFSIMKYAPFLRSLIAGLEEHCEVPRPNILHRKGTDKRIGIVRYHGERVSRIARWLYTDATRFLARKRARAAEVTGLTL